MADIIKLHGDRHLEIQALLPWYVIGRLDPDERGEVEAHLAECNECQAELKFDRQLDLAIASLPADVELGWAAMQQRLQARTPRENGWKALVARLKARDSGWRAAPPWLGWAIAAQLALVLLAGVLFLEFGAPARYQTLGAKPTGDAGNLVVIFRPDASEKAIRDTLRANGARLVDGPTAADAYVLSVPGDVRTQALSRLRGSASVVLAEPVDAPR